MLKRQVILRVLEELDPAHGVQTRGAVTQGASSYFLHLGTVGVEGVPTSGSCTFVQLTFPNVKTDSATHWTWMGMEGLSLLFP